ncbi:hypothetical protein PT974_00634 [Cladobotryum mycophilum]|uniref:EamA domain-containing protein n=1 Tax=Cladobotryum mycophilum TaxID=491253 RepID=A0ABR0T1G8_9HYPO
MNDESRTSKNGHSQWLFFAITSGACAAFNGVFAKLTTTELTTTLSTSIAGILGIPHHEKIVEVVIRAIFFILNLTFNGIVSLFLPLPPIPFILLFILIFVFVFALLFILILIFVFMWSLFTTALKRGRSATQVSIMNTSTNFLVTAFMGMLIFSEALPPMWWAGASLLVAGSVIAGRKDEGDSAPVPAAGETEDIMLVSDEEEPQGEATKPYQDEDVPDLGSP